jgi:tRNA pseudouridine55 synthase
MTGDGLLLAEKGPGATSFQVVARLRHLLRVSRVGHGGTLDPMATGVLPLLLGSATRLLPYLLTHDKEYVATVRLGTATDTLDAAGRVTEEAPVPPLSRPTLEATLARFVGEIEQVPPMYSAVHVGGRRLHELARAGLEIERAPRRVRIDVIELLDWRAPCFTIRVVCGTGTYVRTLAADVGRRLGSVAHLAALVRTRLGPFVLADAVPWAMLCDGDAAGLAARVLPADRAVQHLPAARLDAAGARRLQAGQRLLPAELPAAVRPWPPGPCRLYDRDDRFLGVGELGPAGLRPLRLFHAGDPRPRPVSP